MGLGESGGGGWGLLRSQSQALAQDNKHSMRQ